MLLFWDEEIPIDSIHRAFSFGYVRPAGKGGLPIETDKRL